MTLVVLLQSPLFPPVAMVLLALGYFVLRPARAGRPMEPDEDRGRPDDPQVKRLIAGAIDAKRRRNLSRAGWLYEQGHLWVKSAECYEAGGDGLWAAELYGRGGDHRRAGELYRRHGHPLDAADALTRAGLLGDAGVCYAVVGDLPRAAALFAKAGRPADAAEIYLRMGAFHQAGRLFEAARDPVKAADAYEKMMDTLGRKQLDAAPGIATLLEEQGRIDAAVRFLEAIGEVLQALRTAIRHRNDELSDRLYAVYRDILAGPLLRGAEEGKLSAGILLGLFERAGDDIPAARMAQLLGQSTRAAEFFERGGSYSKAAEEWEAAGELLGAAEAWERGEQFERAGQLFEETDEPRRAIDCYRRAERFAEAGRIHEALGDGAAALECYGQVARSDPAWRSARLKLARMTAAASRWESAVEIYEEALAEAAPTVAEVEDLVALSRLLEARERYGEAAACWAAVILVDPTRAGAEDSFRKMRDEAARAGQEVPRSYPHQPPAPAAFPPAGPARHRDPTPDAGLGGWDGPQGIEMDEGGLPQGLAPLVAAVPGAADPEPEGPAGAPSWDAPIAPSPTDLVSFEAVVGDGATEELARDLGQRPRRGTPITTGQVSLVSASLPPGVEGDTGGWPAWEAGTEDDAPAVPRFPVEEVEAPPPPASAPPPDSGPPSPPPTPDPGDPFAPAANLDDFGLGGAPDRGGIDDLLPSPPAAAEPPAREDGAPDLLTSLEMQAVDDSDDLLSSLERSDDLLSSPDRDDDLLSSLEGNQALLEEPSPSLGPADPVADLCGFPVFSGFDRLEREAIGALLVLEETAAGALITRGQERSDGLILLLDGQVEIDWEGRSSSLLCAPGVGAQEMLLEGDLPGISARAVTDARYWLLTRARARDLAERDRPLAVKLARALRGVERGG